MATWCCYCHEEEHTRFECKKTLARIIYYALPPGNRPSMPYKWSNTIIKVPVLLFVISNCTLRILLLSGLKQEKCCLHWSRNSAQSLGNDNYSYMLNHLSFLLVSGQFPYLAFPDLLYRKVPLLNKELSIWHFVFELYDSLDCSGFEEIPVQRTVDFIPCVWPHIMHPLPYCPSRPLIWCLHWYFGLPLSNPLWKALTHPAASTVSYRAVSNCLLHKTNLADVGPVANNLCSLCGDGE